MSHSSRSDSLARVTFFLPSPRLAGKPLSQATFLQLAQLPCFHLLSTCIPPLFHLSSTLIPPLFHLHSTSPSISLPLFHLYIHLYSTFTMCDDLLSGKRYSQDGKGGIKVEKGGIKVEQRWTTGIHLCFTLFPPSFYLYQGRRPSVGVPHVYRPCSPCKESHRHE